MLDNQTYIIAEIGINHNGDLDIAKRLITAAAEAGFNAVKFQKRTIEKVYTPEELAQTRPNPFGPTNGDLKRALEFNQKQYEAIDQHCKDNKVQWFGSAFDLDSVDFLDQFNPPVHKIASCMLTWDEFLLHVRSKGRPVILSTGMSSIDRIDHAVEVLGKDNLVLLHCTSTYPCPEEDV